MSKKRTYGYYRGQTEEDETRCIENVCSNYVSYQCSRKRGHGPDGLYCKQHDPVRKQKILDTKMAEFEEENREWAAENKRNRILNTIAKNIPTKELKLYKIVKKD